MNNFCGLNLYFDYILSCFGLYNYEDYEHKKIDDNEVESQSIIDIIEYTKKNKVDVIENYMES